MILLIVFVTVYGSPAFIQGKEAPAHNLRDRNPVVQNDIIVLDIFDRTLNDQGIVLVDVDGYMANPAMQYFIVPPPNASFPATVTLTANCARIYFNEPGTVSSSGPGKTIAFADASFMESFFISIWPDRDTENEEYNLSIKFTDSDGLTTVTDVSIAVIDQDEILPL